MNKIINKKRKVAFFLIGLYGGGGEKVVLDLARGFIEDGFKVDLLLFSRKGSLLNRIDLRINIIDLNVSRILFSVFPIIKYLNKEKPVMVLGTSEHANLILILAKIISRTKTKIFVRVGMTFSDLFKNYKKKRDKLIPVLIKILYPKANLVVANSQNVARDLEVISKINKDKIVVIYNPKFISNIIEKSKVGEWQYSDKFTILAIGRLEKQKDFQTLILAFVEIKKKIDVQLIILGEGEQKSELAKLILDLNLRDAYLKGFVQNPYFYMANSNILISTSLWEGFSNVLIEASVLGLPIIATDCGSGSRELLAPNSNFNKQLEKGKIEYADYGVLVAKQDIGSIVKSVLILRQNTELLENYSQKLKQRSQIFGVAEILKQYKEIIFNENI